jgi:hypothetical protein
MLPYQKGSELQFTLEQLFMVIQFEFCHAGAGKNKAALATPRRWSKVAHSSSVVVGIS